MTTDTPEPATTVNDERDQSATLCDAPLPTQPISPSKPRGRALAIAVCALIVGAGFAGLDRVFYENVSMRFNTGSVLNADPYQLTKPFWHVVRKLGAHAYGIIAALCAMVAFTDRGLRRAAASGITVIAVAIFANFAQALIGRARPNQANSHLTFNAPFSGGLSAEGMGFPSGEATTAVALAVTLSCAFPKLRWAFAGVAFLVILARVLPGMHYVSDVVVGAALALFLTPPLLALATRLILPTSSNTASK